MTFEEMLSAIPLRLRIGGDSMDSSTFVANQTQFSIFINPNANPNDQSVDFGPIVFNVLDAVSKSLGGVEYLIGELKPLVQNWHDPQTASWCVRKKYQV